jgi:hypothetical protein
MTAHDRAVQLVAARLDFGLASDEREVLKRHLADCVRCRGEATAIADDARRLASRPVHVLAPERASAMRAALEGPCRTMSPAVVLLAAALLLLLGIAVVAAGASVVRLLDRDLAVIPTPSVAPASVAGWRHLVVSVENQSARPAVLRVAEDLGSPGQARGTATPSVVPPNTTLDVIFRVPDRRQWSIFVNAGANAGAIVTHADVPTDANGLMPFTLFISANGQPGASMPETPGWFGDP